MAIVGWDIENYKRCRQYTEGGSMLMLGNQDWPHEMAYQWLKQAYNKNKPWIEEPWKLVFGVTAYSTVDMDGGDLKRDLDLPHVDLDQGWDTVMNIGTIEHCWNVHQAYSTAARMVRVGGYYIGHAPVKGFANHGINITTARAIAQFFINNGFELCEEWQQDRQEGTIQWLIVKKLRHVTEFTMPKQIWVEGVDGGVV